MIDQEILKQNTIEGWIVVTQDFSGLGFAKMLQDGSGARGYPRTHSQQKVLVAVSPKDKEDDFEHLKKVGEGIVKRINWDKLWEKRNEYKNWAWVWDQNFGEADTLRKEGFPFVFAGHKLTDKMEHDREFGISLVKKAGLSYPNFTECSSVKEGLEFMDKNPDIVYIFKPDASDDKSWVTTTPDADNDERARKEMYDFLKAQPEGKGTFVLQERKKGVEINTEIWLYNGKPFFSFSQLEAKRKYNGDLGKMIGCAHDVAFTLPLHCKINEDTVMKLTKLPEFKNFTGFLDVNLIVCDNEYYFLEFCGRFGYNSHPNLFLTLALDPMSEILSDFIQGKTDNFYRHFRKGYGASITCWIDEPALGIPVIFEDEKEVESRFFHFDTYKDETGFHTAGYANEVGIICAHDYDIKSACEEAIHKFGKIHYPGRAGRTDLPYTGYKSNPRERYEACVEMGLFEENVL